MEIEGVLHFAQPGYDVKHAATTVYFQNFDVATGGWVHASPSTDSGLSSIADDTRSPVFYVYTPSSPWSTKAKKTVAGLVVGRSYTLSAWVGMDNDGQSAKVGVTGKSYGTTVTGWSANTFAWKKCSYTFTATATSHELLLESSYTSGSGSLSPVYWDEVVLSKDAWTEHFSTADIDLDMDIKDAEITLDDSWTPYAQARVTIPMPTEENLEFIDPRESVRATLTATKDTTTRTFDLGLRDRTVNHKDQTLELEFASDEGLLLDYARVATTADSSYKQYENNLRTLVNAVLTDVLGKTLETDNSDTANLTVYAASTNLVANPSAETNTTGWAAGNCTLGRGTYTGTTGSYAFNISSPTASSPYIQYAGVTVTPGETYVLSVRGRASTVGSGATIADARKFQVLNSSGTTLLASTSALPNTTTWNTGYVEFTVPAGVTSVILRGIFGHAAGIWLWDAVKFAVKGGGYEADRQYFDGDTTATAQYTYAWTGTAHASTSTRTDISNTGRDGDMFVWEPGVSAWDFLTGLTQAAGLRLFCDEQRKWHLIDPASYSVPGLVSLSEGMNITEAEDTISRNSDGWYDSVVIKYSWVDRYNIPRVAWDKAGTAGGKTLTIEKTTPYPGAGAAQAWLSKATAKGRSFDVSALSDYTVTPGQSIQIDLPSTPEQVGVTSAVTWDFNEDEMSIKTRLLGDVATRAWYRETPGNTWNSISAGVKWSAFTPS